MFVQNKRVTFSSPSSIQFFCHIISMQLFTKTDISADIFKYMFIIHETLNGVETFYHQQHSKVKIFNKKKTQYINLVKQAMENDRNDNCVKFYSCLFAEMVIAKISAECFIIVMKQCMEVRCFNCKSGLIEWIFTSGFFSSRSGGCSCDRCNYERLEEYREKSGLCVTKERIMEEIGEILQ